MVWFISNYEKPACFTSVWSSFLFPPIILHGSNQEMKRSHNWTETLKENNLFYTAY